METEASKLMGDSETQMPSLIQVKIRQAESSKIPYSVPYQLREVYSQQLKHMKNRPLPAHRVSHLRSSARIWLNRGEELDDQQSNDVGGVPRALGSHVASRSQLVSWDQPDAM